MPKLGAGDGIRNKGIGDRTGRCKPGILGIREVGGAHKAKTKCFSGFMSNSQILAYPAVFGWLRSMAKISLWRLSSGNSSSAAAGIRGRRGRKPYKVAFQSISKKGTRVVAICTAMVD
jgi:hypothetical protein